MIILSAQKASIAPLSNSAGAVDVVSELVVELDVFDVVLLLIITSELFEISSALSLPEQLTKRANNTIFNKIFNLISSLLNFYKIKQSVGKMATDCLLKSKYVIKAFVYS